MERIDRGTSSRTVRDPVSLLRTNGISCHLWPPHSSVHAYTQHVLTYANSGIHTCIHVHAHMINSILIRLGKVEGGELFLLTECE